MMKRIICYLLIPCLAFSATVVKQYTFKAPVVRDNVVYVEGCNTSVIPFEPCLPSKPITLMLPYGEDASSFAVEYGNPIEVSGEFYIEPFRPGGIMTNPIPKDYYSRSSMVYSVDQFYPVEIKSPQYFTQYRYGHSLFIASLRPVQYNPVTGKMRYFRDIIVKVKTEKKRGDLPVYKFNSFIKSQLQLEIDNPELLNNLTYTPRDGDDYDYLIVTTEALKNSWNDFLEFNMRRCLKTQLKTIEEINSTVSGTDSPDKLKKYIKQEYTTHSITYVMLGGDDNFNTNNTPKADAITHRSYSAEFKDYGINLTTDTDIAADMYYETMDGDQLNDLEWEVYAARFPADDATELKRIIDKTIKYSEQPVTGAVNKFLLAGETAWPNINGGTCYGKAELYLLKDGSSKNGYTTVGYDMKKWTLLDLQEPDISWTKTQVINHVNSGLNFIHHIGHSNNTMIMKMSISDISMMSNSAYFIGQTIGCYCGAWDNRKIATNATINTGHYDAVTGDCIAEAFTVGSANAAVAYISNTRYGLGDDGHASQDGTDGSSTRLTRHFVDAVHGKKMHHIAIMHAYSKWINKTQILNTDMAAKPYYGQMRYVAFEHNVLGDPALSVWTAAPQTLNPTIAATISGDKFEWASGLPYTWIAICKPDGNIITSNFTGEDGKCLINDALYTAYCSANAGGKVKVRVKAHNYLPFEKEVTISGTGIVSDNLAALHQLIAQFNPAKKAIVFSYLLNRDAMVHGTLYNAKGMLVRTLLNEHQMSGLKEFSINIGNVADGVYYYKIKVNNSQFVNKILIK